MTAASPRVTWTTRVTATAGHTSAPVEGHEVWVDRSTAAVGRPSAASARCFSGERYPLMIWTGKGRRPAIRTNRRDSSSEISQRVLSPHAEDSSVGIASGITHIAGGGASLAPIQWSEFMRTVTVPAASETDV